MTASNNWRTSDGSFKAPEFYAALMRAFGIPIVEMDWNEDNDENDNETNPKVKLPFKITKQHFEDNFNGTEEDMEIDDDEAREFSKATLEWWNEYVDYFFLLCPSDFSLEKYLVSLRSSFPARRLQKDLLWMLYSSRAKHGDCRRKPPSLLPPLPPLSGTMLPPPAARTTRWRIMGRGKRGKATRTSTREPEG
jgi:hypothetical protein